MNQQHPPEIFSQEVAPTTTILGDGSISCFALSCSVRKLRRQRLDNWELTFRYFCQRFLNRKPRRTIDFGNINEAAGLWRPFNLTIVAL
jgi:hypothetical protein